MAWDSHMWAKGQSYEEVRNEMGTDDLFKQIQLKDISKAKPDAVQGNSCMTYFLNCLDASLSY